MDVALPAVPVVPGTNPCSIPVQVRSKRLQNNNLVRSEGVPLHRRADGSTLPMGKQSDDNRKLLLCLPIPWQDRQRPER